MQQANFSHLAKQLAISQIRRLEADELPSPCSRTRFAALSVYASTSFIIIIMFCDIQEISVWHVQLEYGSAS
jgi:hypothetical protein